MADTLNQDGVWEGVAEDATGADGETLLAQAARPRVVINRPAAGQAVGPLSVQPGEEIVLPEDWWLFGDVAVPTDEHEALTTLQTYIGRAPTP